MTDREIQVRLSEEVAAQLKTALTAAAPQQSTADREQALARITELAGGKVDPALLKRAYKVLGHDPEAPEGAHAGAA
ncbi:hypothetical protein [Nocardia heshunensis]